MLTAAAFAYRIETTWVKIEQNTIERSAALTDLVAAVGYGGMIHNLKNYVLRGGTEYRDAAESSIVSARAAIDHYCEVASVTPEETVSVASINELLRRYEAALDNAEGAGSDAALRDAAARIDDEPFEAAIVALRNTLDAERARTHLAFERELEFAVFIGMAVGIGALLVICVGGGRLLHRHAQEVEDAVQSLRHAEDIVHETGRVAKIGGWMIDLNTMTPIWSEEVRRIHEVDDDYQPDLETAINFYAPEARPIIERLVREGIEKGTSWDVEVPLITAKGRQIWTRALGRPEFENGVCTRLWGAFQDVTDGVHARQEIEELQARISRAIDGTSDGLWEFDLVDDRAWYSDQFQRLVGLDVQSGIALDRTPEAYTARLHPDDRGDVLAALTLPPSDEPRFDVEHRLRMQDGTYRWFRARGIWTFDDDGCPVRVSGTLADIHDQRVAESRLDLATRAARLGLWDWDVPSDAVHMNDMYGSMLGYEPGELACTVETWKELLHPEDVAAAAQRVQAHFNGETAVYSADFRMKARDGGWHWIRGVGELVERNDDGSPKRMIGVHIDIEEAQAALAKAEEASRAKSDFLANMSHEIRTPMTAILGYADLLSGDLKNDAESTAELVKTISANAQHLMVVINDILDVSKIEAGQMSLELIDTSIGEMLDQVAALTAPRAAAKGIAFKITRDQGTPERVRTDPTRVKQILMNLAGNALKFTEHGEVAIRVSYAEPSQTLTMRIIDTGIGMSAEERDRVARFEAFTQADASTTRRFGGTGLGLRISNALAAMMDGTIEVESEPGVGSAFTLNISAPVIAHTGTASPSTPKDPEPSPEAPRPLAGLNIMLAEDGPDNQRLISFYLEKAGASVVLCANGREAIDVLENADDGGRPDLVLMDMQMPVLDGYSAASQLRTMGVSVPIIAVTAHAMGDDRARCIDAGCDDYIAKPIDRTLLIETCARLGRLGTSRDAA
ncbi:MAG: PAS domain-containing protein [Planctomycetota bacterium]